MNKKTKDLDDWRRRAMSRIRTLIKEADPEVIEEVKWRKPSNPAGIPVWYHDGMICTGETYKNHLRLTFAQGASLKDPEGIINTYRALIIREGDKINETAFKELVRVAVAFNRKSKSGATPRTSLKRPRKER
jgi:hypothetical protein